MTGTVKSFFIFGAGYSGRAFGRLMAAQGIPVAGTTRSPDKAEALRAEGIAPHLFDATGVSPDLLAALAATTHLIVSIAPDENGDPVLNALRGVLEALPLLEWTGYLSTVGVYGDHDGAWVDEETECRPVSQRSIQRLAAEMAWQDFADSVGKPLAILRLSGIYGSGRNAFVNLDRGMAKRLIKPGQVFNRIHVEDIARALEFLSGRHAEGIYNITDNEPAPPQDVVEYAASLMKIDPPAAIDFETATISPMARSFYGENKRVSNAKVRKAGFEFRHGDYRKALDRMWAEDSWR
ncbi:SDR family oxidoreductase [Oricola nitratireducens]|uniref:SDR family oxidoreductase n=1 Tax=Oricola nitratireducens TaxID=2775868 RepID=UPI001869059C|nr:SDR family oxidoreductase [Oricola nitratireducens]